MSVQTMSRPTTSRPARRAQAMLAAGLLATAFLVGSGGTAAQASTVTESEPNGSFETANVVSPGSTVTGSSLRASSFDEDYFAVDFPADARMGLDLEFPAGLGSGSAYDVSVFTASGSLLYSFPLTGDRSDGTWLQSQATFTPAGRVFVRISGYSDRATWGQTYALTVSSTPGTVETELNSSTAAADVVALGSTVTGSSLRASSFDEDYYAVDFGFDSRVGLNLKFPAGLGSGSAYDVDVMNASGTLLYSFALTGDRSDGTWLKSQATFTPAGRLYVRITGYSSRATWGKAYSLQVTATHGTVETELNSSTAAADVVTLGSKVTGSSLRASSFDEDYYAADFPADARMWLDLRFPAGLGAGAAYDVAVFNAAGTQLYGFALTGDRNDGSWLRSQAMFTPAGRVYVRVTGNNTRTTWGQAYTLVVSSTPGIVETELNSSTAAADVVALGSTVMGSSLRASSSDEDYYAVDAPAAGRVRLDLRFPTGLGSGSAYDVAVFNAAGTQLYGFQLTGDRSDGSWLRNQSVTLPQGRAYVRIAGSDSRATWGRPYTLAVASVLTKTPVPTVSGTAKVGRVLTAKSGTWSPGPVALTYQWLRNGSTIAGATKSSYTPVTADAGTKVAVRVTGTKTGYVPVATTSASLLIAK